MLTVRCGNNKGQNCDRKGGRKGTQVQELTYRGTTNVGHETYDYTSNDWRHQYSKKRFKEKFGSFNRKTFSTFTTNTAILGTSHIRVMW